MKHIQILILLILFSFCSSSASLLEQRAPYNIGIVGYVLQSDGIGRLTISIIDCLKDLVPLSFITTKKKVDMHDVPLHLQPYLRAPAQEPCTVTLFVDMLTRGDEQRYQKVPPNSFIKIAYTMFESTAIPKEWATILNKHFDAAVVPDPYLVNVYQSSGVTIPIFVIPIGIYLEPFLQQPLKKSAHKPFVFGCSAAFVRRKNQQLLLESFNAAFGNNPNIMLILHGRYTEKVFNQIQTRLNQLQLSNVKIVAQELDWQEYSKLFSLFDCYVLLSKGEGFSITPREAMALGMPCILSNNTAHQTLCATGLVTPVASQIKEPAYYKFWNQNYGYNFNCTKNDVVAALKDVYEHYSTHLLLAHKRRVWAQQYCYSNLKPYYLTLVNPRKVILGPHNLITQDFLMTNSNRLYTKYISLTHYKRV